MSRATRQLRRTLAALVMAGVVLTTPAVAAPGGTGQPAAPGGTGQPAPAGRIMWRQCTDDEFRGMQCGTMRVPVDWSEPRAAQLELALVRRTADDPSHRKGTLLLNDGAGGSSIEQLRLAMHNGFPGSAGAMTRRFDIVAVDPRGVGHSTPIRCAEPLKPAGISYFPRNRAAFDRLVAHNRTFARDCLRRNGSLVAHTDLTSVARDVEAVRTGLGVQRLDWYGIHYSTLLGRTYAALFPGRLRTMTLDTALDDTTSPLTRIVKEATSAEEAFNRFAAWCTDSADCALKGRDVAAAYDALVARADRSPLPVAGGTHRPLTGDDIRGATQDYLNIASVTWPALAQAIVKAQAGDATDFTLDPDGTLDPVQVLVPACLDNARPVGTFEQLARLHTMLAARAPHLGGAVRSQAALAGCLGWPVPAKPVRAGGLVPGAPPALVIQSTHQALAPHAAGSALAAQLPGSVVLSREGDDYSMFLLSRCVRAATNRYLTDRVLPAPGTTCTN
ncbi:alpha/beta fold hydrolase [Streptomyces sp. NPDC015125]|uniref:alpha/beta fold hydrolase n=1 Tax=Streptomyces sp. NPDC015125 TaxID=3364938 RepID=UPI0036FDA754